MKFRLAHNFKPKPAKGETGLGRHGMIPAGSKLGSAVLVVVCLWVFPGPFAAAAGLTSSERSACLDAGAAAAVAACGSALGKDPGDSGIRMALADALVETQDYRRATNVLRQGLELEPGNTSIKGRLSQVESMLQEQLWIEQRNRQRKASQTSEMKSGQRVAASRYEIRCTRLKGDQALAACNEGLSVFPGNAKLYRGKGNALMALQRYGEAQEALGDALVLAPGHQETQQQLNKARTLRAVSAKKCLQLSGPVALDACAAALVRGGDDEAILLSRQGDLFSAMGKRQAAAAAFRSALAVMGSDGIIEGKLAALGYPAGRIQAEQPAEQALGQPEAEPQKAVPETASLTAPKPAPGKPAPVQKTEPAAEPSIQPPKEPVPKPPPEPLVRKPPVKPEPEPVVVLFSNAPTVPGMTH